MIQKPAVHKAELITKNLIAENIWEYTFKGLGGNFNFSAGQYVTIFIDRNTRRQYSISSSPYLLPEFQIIFDIRPNGPGTQYLLELATSHNIEFLGPIGTFTLTDKLPQELNFIATGTGISPLKSMIEKAVADNIESAINLYFGTRYRNEVIHQEFFGELKEKGKIKKYKVCLSRERIDGIDTGHVTQYINDMDKHNSDFFLCGSGEMIRSVENLLLKSGVNLPQIHYEKFY